MATPVMSIRPAKIHVFEGLDTRNFRPEIHRRLTGVGGERRSNVDGRKGRGERAADGLPGLRGCAVGGCKTDTVANASNRLDELAPSGLDAVELAANVIDVDIDDVGSGLGFELPDVGKQFTAGDALTTAEHEVLEEGKLLGGEGDLPAAALDEMIDSVEFEVAGAKDLLGELRTATEEGAAAGGELEEAEGLQQAVVGAHIETLDASMEIAAAGEDQKSGVRALRLEIGEDFDTVAVGEAEVEDDQVRLVFGGVAERRISIVQPLGGVAFVFHSLF